MINEYTHGSTFAEKFATEEDIAKLTDIEKDTISKNDFVNYVNCCHMMANVKEIL
jgi:hypothetical protein